MTDQSVIVNPIKENARRHKLFLLWVRSRMRAYGPDFAAQTTEFAGYFVHRRSAGAGKAGR
ncbi:hypothetical protein ACE103_26530 [Bradyrhizobium sp. ma5]|uniref:hypothetical protein n=1 Tax=Bradyrhizobium sp. ma5 TaxID=3344828 RepID=UPI0035D3DD94